MRIVAASLAVTTSLAALGAGCGSKKKTDDAPASAVTAVVEERPLDGAGFCKAVLRAPLDATLAACAPAERERLEVKYFSRAAEWAEARCVEQLAEPVKEGRLGLDQAKAKACIAEVQKLGPRFVGERMRRFELGRVSACAGIFAPRQGLDAPCSTSLECKDGLSCVGAEEATAGRCTNGKTAQGCSMRSVAFGLERKSDCAASHACVGGSGRTLTGLRLGVEQDPWAGGLGLSGIGTGSRGHSGNGIGLGTIGVGPQQGLGRGYGGFSKPRGKPPTLRMGEVKVSGRLPPEVIRRIVRQNFGRFRHCYEQGLRTDPTLAGKVALELVIAKDGSVAQVRDGGSGLRDKGVVACMLKHLHALTFPAPEGGVVKVSYGLELIAPEAAPGGAPGSVLGGPLAGDAGAPDAAGPADAGEPSASDAGALAEGDAGGPREVVLGAYGASMERVEKERLWGGGTCVVRGTPGATCIFDADCSPGLSCVAAACAERGAGDAACYEDADCPLEQHCEWKNRATQGPLASPDRCVPRKAAGAACTRWEECLGACDAGVCVSLCGSG